MTRVIRGLRATLNGPATKPLAAIQEVTVSVTRPPSKGTIQHLHSFIVRLPEMQTPKVLFLFHASPPVGNSSVRGA